MSERYSPDAIEMGVPVIARSVVFLPPPPLGQEHVTPWVFSELMDKIAFDGIPTERFMSGRITATPRPANPNYLDIVVVVNLFPNEYLEYLERMKARQAAAAMAEIAGDVFEPDGIHFEDVPLPAEEEE